MNKKSNVITCIISITLILNILAKHGPYFITNHAEKLFSIIQVLNVICLIVLAIDLFLYLYNKE